jgi:hypothetical protein
LTKREELARLLELASALADLIKQVAHDTAQEEALPAEPPPPVFSTWN